MTASIPKPSVSPGGSIQATIIRYVSSSEEKGDCSALQSMYAVTNPRERANACSDFKR